MTKHIMTIGSIYGEDRWKDLDILEAMITDDSLTPTYDKYVFMGNYVKSYWKEQADIGTMMGELLALKENYPDHIVLLIGRDDLQYMYPAVSKFKIEGIHKDITYYSELFSPLLTYLAPSYFYGNTLWTSAGVFIEWASVVGITAANNAESVSTIINNIEEGTSSQQYFLDVISGGGNVASSPIYGTNDKSSLIEWVNHVITDDNQSKTYNKIKRTPFLSTVCQLTEHKITDYYTRKLEDSVLIEYYEG